MYVPFEYVGFATKVSVTARVIAAHGYYERHGADRYELVFASFSVSHFSHAYQGDGSARECLEYRRPEGAYHLHAPFPAGRYSFRMRAYGHGVARRSSSPAPLAQVYQDPGPRSVVVLQ